MAENMTIEFAAIDFLFDFNSNLGSNSTLNGCSNVLMSDLEHFRRNRHFEHFGMLGGPGLKMG
jgi:hypothetical protein